MKSEPASFAYTLYCEDYRLEAGGKYSLIGVYPGEIGVKDETQRFSKFVFLTVINASPELFGKTYQLILQDKEEILVQTHFDLPNLDDEKNELSRVVIQMPIEASPFDAKVGMVISVKIKGPSFQYESIPLRVKKFDDVDQGTEFKLAAITN